MIPPPNGLPSGFPCPQGYWTLSEGSSSCSGPASWAERHHSLLCYVPHVGTTCSTCSTCSKQPKDLKVVLKALNTIQHQICSWVMTGWHRPLIIFAWHRHGPENPKARRHAARLFKVVWCGQLCSARNRRKIFTETSCALMVSGATIHHSMLCQLRLHSSSRYFCYCN